MILAIRQLNCPNQFKWKNLIIKGEKANLFNFDQYYRLIQLSHLASQSAELFKIYP